MSEALARLRLRAEHALEREPTLPRGDANTPELVHELEVHHVELSMQNDELLAAQAKLEKSRADYQLLFDDAPVGYVICTPKGRIERANAFASDLLGMPAPDLVGVALPRFAAADHLDVFHHHIGELLEREVTTCHMQLRSANGRHSMVRLNSRALRDEAGAVTRLQICLVDLTEREEAERRVRELTEQHERDAERFRRSKLESIGRLAGGIAHAFNNQLGVVRASLDLARALPPDAVELIGDAEAAARRATELANQLLTFAEGGAPIKRAINLGILVSRAAQLAVQGTSVALERAVADDLWIEGDAGQLRQVVQSLVANATDAMPHGGVLRVRVDDVAPDDDLPAELPAGRYVVIEVADDGEGISEDALPYVFEPHFSTRRERTGLGLAIVSSVVERHGGAVDLVSRPGEGTSVRVYLPAARSARVVETVRASDVSQSPTPIRILIMDDEPALRKLSARIFSGHGYHVDTFATGEEAVAAFEVSVASGEPYDVVILDLTVVGGMGGRDTIVALRAIDPDVQAIVCSGYADDPVMASPEAHGFRRVVTKPYAGAELRKAVAELVGAHRDDSNGHGSAGS